MEWHSPGIFIVIPEINFNRNTEIRNMWHSIFSSFSRILTKKRALVLTCCACFHSYSYGAIRSGYGQHFGPQGGQDSGFPSPRSALGYPFPAMQNSYSSYHLGGYAPPCASPPKDGKFKIFYVQWCFEVLQRFNQSQRRKSKKPKL